MSVSTPLRIAIDASRTTVSRVTGTEHYALQLLRSLIQLNDVSHHHGLTFYFRDSPAPGLFPDSPYVTHRVIPAQRLWTHLRFAAALWQDPPDVTFVPAHTLPILFPGHSVVTVHDLGFKYFPQAHPLKSRLYLDLTTRYSARRAGVVLADSAATSADLTHFYRTPSEKIQVVYPGIDAPVIENIAQVRARYHLPERYFLFIGTLQPRKNIDRLVQAFAQYRSMTGDSAGLVLAGGKGWLYDPAWTAGIEGVLLPGYIDDTDKGALYAGALALVFPSLYEGFGFPVLEAMLCGTPVIASNTSSLPELTGDAGITVDPLDIDGIANAMQQITGNPELADRLKQSGYVQAQKFTWSAAASSLMQALEDAAGRSIAT